MGYISVLSFKNYMENFVIPEDICLLASAFPPIYPLFTTQIIVNII